MTEILIEKLEEYPMAQSITQDYYLSVQNNSKTLELIFNRFLITQSLYLESLTAKSLENSKMNLFESCLKFDVINGFREQFTSYLHTMKGRMINFFQLELQALDKIVKERLEISQVKNEELDNLMSQEFWYSNIEADKFKGFERQKFSSTLTNKLRAFFYDNRGVTPDERDRVYKSNPVNTSSAQLLEARRESLQVARERYYSRGKLPIVENAAYTPGQNNLTKSHTYKSVRTNAPTSSPFNQGSNSKIAAHRRKQESSFDRSKRRQSISKSKNDSFTVGIPSTAPKNSKTVSRQRSKSKDYAHHTSTTNKRIRSRSKGSMRRTGSGNRLSKTTSTPFDEENMVPYSESLNSFGDGGSKDREVNMKQSTTLTKSELNNYPEDNRDIFFSNQKSQKSPNKFSKTETTHNLRSGHHTYGRETREDFRKKSKSPVQSKNTAYLASPESLVTDISSIDRERMRTSRQPPRMLTPVKDGQARAFFKIDTKVITQQECKHLLFYKF